jgi:hypothetical protein
MKKTKIINKLIQKRTTLKCRAICLSGNLNNIKKTTINKLTKKIKKILKEPSEEKIKKT